MPNCNKCQSAFPNLVKIEGKTRNLCNRKFCLVCSPFKRHNTSKNPSRRKQVGKSFCSRCQQTLSNKHFYKRRTGDGHTSYCRDCLKTQARERQTEFKKRCVEYKGGSCVICGYNKCLAAMDFHHLDPSKKEFRLSQKKDRRNWNQIAEELDKCVLLCCRCHREVHDGVTMPSAGIEPTFAVLETAGLPLAQEG